MAIDPTDPPQFIPPDDTPLTDAEQAQELEDLSGDLLLGAEDVVVLEDAPTPVGRSWDFDFVDGCFVINPRLGPVKTYGDKTLANWIEKTLKVARGAHPIYPDGYGMEDPHAEIGAPLDSFDAASLERRVTEALVYHPRIQAIENFTAATNEDDLTDEGIYVTFDVVKDDGGFLAIGTLPVAV